MWAISVRSVTHLEGLSLRGVVTPRFEHDVFREKAGEHHHDVVGRLSGRKHVERDDARFRHLAGESGPEIVLGVKVFGPESLFPKTLLGDESAASPSSCQPEPESRTANDASLCLKNRSRSCSISSASTYPDISSKPHCSDTKRPEMDPRRFKNGHGRHSTAEVGLGGS
jgi:hypothetical protein